MILIEDANNENYYINSKNVVYIKERQDAFKKERWWKITFVNGEQLHTKNEAGVKSIISRLNT
jgi:hypothetical protein